MLLMCQVVLLHPVGCEFIGRHSRKSRAMQTLNAEQQHNSRSTQIYQQHDVTSRLGAVMVLVYKWRQYYVQPHTRSEISDMKLQSSLNHHGLKRATFPCLQYLE